MHERARAAAMAVEAKKDSLRQNQDGTWKLVLTVAPDGLPGQIMQAMPGTRYQCAFVEVDDNEEPVPQERKRRHFDEMSRAEQAGMLCNDPKFQRWIRPPHWSVGDGEAAVEDARSAVLEECHPTGGRLGSRKQLDEIPEAGELWDRLVAQFHADVGRSAEKR